jgi:hypothetical protein
MDMVRHYLKTQDLNIFLVCDCMQDVGEMVTTSPVSTGCLYLGIQTK